MKTKTKQKLLKKIITFIVLVGAYIIMPYPEFRYFFYIILVMLFIKVTDIAMQMKDDFDELYDSYIILSSLLEKIIGDNKTDRSAN